MITIDKDLGPAEEIKIRYFDLCTEDGSKKRITPLQQVDGSDWIDVRCGYSTTLHAGEMVYIPLGFACQLPKGYEAILAPRSSSFKKYGFIVANSFGVIDGSYCGNKDEWKLCVYCTRDAHINFDERIAQFRIQKVQPTIMFTEVNDLENESRGGFGSTDAKEANYKS